MIGLAKKKQITKQMPNDTTAQISRVRSSKRCSINGALVASRAASSSAVGLTTRGGLFDRGDGGLQPGKRMFPLQGVESGAQSVEVFGPRHLGKTLAQSL